MRTIGKTIVQGTLISAILLCFLIAPLAAERQEKVIRIAFIPCYEKMTVYKRFYPLLSYLEKQTGFRINLIVPKDMAEVEDAMKNSNIDFILQDPQMYLNFEKYFRKDSLLKSLNRSGGALQHGVFITKKGSGIKSMRDLKGKTVMFGKKLSATKWPLAILLLRENGINIEKDLKSYSHGGCCEDIAFTVFLGGVDAGVVCEHFLEQHPQQQQELGIDKKQLVVIGETEPVPTRVFAAHRAAPQDIVAKVYQALLGLDVKKPEHAGILFPAELGGFQKVKDQDFDKLRELSRSNPTPGGKTY